MIAIDLLIAESPGLRRQDLEAWLSNRWVRADGPPSRPMFHDIDVARIRLIRELRDDMAVNDEALPIILSLLDQLYDLRRLLREHDRDRSQNQGAR